MKEKTLTLGNLLLALAGFLFLISFSVTLVLNLREIYYFDIGYLNLESETGYSEEVIRANYDALIDYNLLIKDVDELEFPDFPMSENAATHFREVKQIFVALQVTFFVTGVILAVFCVATVVWRKRFSKRKPSGKKEKKQRSRLAANMEALKLLSVFAFAIPVVLGILAAVNWDSFFTRFHEIFFQNDYWLFDPVTDPVILILPDAFFAHCAAAILLILFLGGILTGILYGRLRRAGIAKNHREKKEGKMI
ncbi:MAG: TIGR01906 family membrane protein [Lachnospiraceae bacterium]|nr:TIGR01906 family membrane protein [Lachnospiraceae bacterium]